MHEHVTSRVYTVVLRLIRSIHLTILGTVDLSPLRIQYAPPQPPGNSMVKSMVRFDIRVTCLFLREPEPFVLRDGHVRDAVALRTDQGREHHPPRRR